MQPPSTGSVGASTKSQKELLQLRSARAEAGHLTWSYEEAIAPCELRRAILLLRRLQISRAARVWLPTRVPQGRVLHNGTESQRPKMGQGKPLLLSLRYTSYTGVPSCQLLILISTVPSRVLGLRFRATSTNC